MLTPAMQYKSPDSMRRVRIRSTLVLLFGMSRSPSWIAFRKRLRVGDGDMNQVEIHAIKETGQISPDFHANNRCCSEIRHERHYEVGNLKIVYCFDDRHCTASVRPSNSEITRNPQSHRCQDGDWSKSRLVVGCQSNKRLTDGQDKKELRGKQGLFEIVFAEHTCSPYNNSIRNDILWYIDVSSDP